VIARIEDCGDADVPLVGEAPDHEGAGLRDEPLDLGAALAGTHPAEYGVHLVAVERYVEAADELPIEEQTAGLLLASLDGCGRGLHAGEQSLVGWQRDVRVRVEAAQVAPFGLDDLPVAGRVGFADDAKYQPATKINDVIECRHSCALL